MEKPKDRDFLETRDDLIFCVVGYLHSPDRVTAYLKYVPDPQGKWNRGKTRYNRVLPYYHVTEIEKTYEFLEKYHSEYIFNCPVRNITLSAIPHNRIKKYYKPRERLNTIISNGSRDALEYKVISLITILKGLSGLSVRDLGITGSILTSNHNLKFSDIDITVYGSNATNRLKETILETRGDGVIMPSTLAKMENWSRTRAERFPLNIKELRNFAERRWNYGYFMDTYFSIHPVRTDEEIVESYGDFRYKQLRIVTGRGEIEDVSEAIYLPAIYGMNNVKLDGKVNVEPVEVVSYEGLFCDMFEEGEIVSFKGILEKVTGKDDYHRVVIGGAGSESSFIKLMC